VRDNPIVKSIGNSGWQIPIFGEILELIISLIDKDKSMCFSTAKLSQHPELWVSFLFTKPIFAPDENGLSFGGVIDTLITMANYCPMPEDSIIHFVNYPADTLENSTE
jgi:hypothetical protein